MSRIVAKHDGACTTCSAAIIVGDEVEWSRETGARCLKCARNGQRRNQRAGACRKCGVDVPPGVGLLFPEFPPAMTWMGEQVTPTVPSSWRVECSDTDACMNRLENRAFFSGMTIEQIAAERARLVAELRSGSAIVLDLSDRHGEVLVLVQGRIPAERAQPVPEDALLISSTTNDVWIMRYDGEPDAGWLDYPKRRAVEAYGVLLTSDLERRARGLAISTGRF